MQKEAYIFNLWCHVLHTVRENTEWVETVEDSGNVLVAASKEKIVTVATDFEPTNEQRDVFGCGDASVRIEKPNEGVQGH